MKPLTFALLTACILSGVAAGQGPAKAAPAPATTVTPANPAEAPPVPPSNFAYSVDGRRDPFLSLVNRGTAGRTGQPGSIRPEGLNGVGVEEVAIRGIYQSRGQWVAMIAAPSGRTYSIRAGDRLMDGSVKTVSASDVVLMQDVNDPLSLQKQREVRKSLRGEVK